MSRLLNGDYIFSQDLTQEGQLDQRYAVKNNLTGFNEYVKDKEIINLNSKYAEINELGDTINLNKGVNVSGSNLLIKTEAYFESGANIKGNFFLNGKEILVNADGILYTPKLTVG